MFGFDGSATPLSTPGRARTSCGQRADEHVEYAQSQHCCTFVLVVPMVEGGPVRGRISATQQQMCQIYPASHILHRIGRLATLS